jgi:hypothetical protein
MVSYHGQDWVSHLGTIEYAHATMISTSTNMTPFELDTGRKVRNAVVQDFGSTPSEEVPIADFAKKFAAQRQKIIELARKNLLAAQERQKKYYDRKRRTVEFKEGDYVLLDTRNLPLKRITEQTGDTKEKFAARHIGPFQIEKMINSNVARLKLPSYLSRLHPSFNVEFLEHSVDNPDKFASRPLPKTAPVLLEDDTEQELHFPEALLKRMQRNNKRLFLVKWHGLPDSDNSWEYEDKLRKVSHWRELLRTFNANRQGD